MKIKLPPGVVYMASPYSHTDPKVRQARYEAMTDFMATAITNPAFTDCFPYSPIIAWHTAAFRNNLPKSASYWKAQNQKIIKLAVDLVVVTLDGWKESAGIKEEISMFATKGIQPLYAYFSANGDIEIWTQ